MPLKRHPALQDYSREHHDELLLVWKIRKGLKNNISTGRIIDYCVYHYNEMTAIHMANEEKFILAKLLPHDNDRIKVLNDHAVINEIVKQLSEDSTADKTKLLHEFADKLEEHIRFEERVFFQKLQDSLPEAIIKSMQLPENKSLECAVWTDAFWE